MHLGLIPPISLLPEFGDGPFHLLLSHLLAADADQGYRIHYQKQAENGAYMVLDNSAYEEGAGHDIPRLVDEAIMVGAKEIVVPDVMHDYKGTMTATRLALIKLSSVYSTELEDHKIQLMLVPHGATIFEWGSCLNEHIIQHQLMFGLRKFTIGVPKDYEQWPGGRANLIQRFIEPLRDKYDFDVHLLGVGEDLNMINALRVRFPWIRSTDTAKPFVYGWHRIRLSNQYYSPPEYPGRPDNYFNLEFDQEQIDLSRINSKIMQTRAEESPVR